MPCYHPLKGYRARTPNPSGKRSIVFQKCDGYADLEVELPCGQCIGCRLERSRMWAIRITHESSLYENNAFITLTYDDEHVPKDGSLRVDHFQKFMKRLRKHFHPTPIRFFHCGEYGEKNARPHYHACLFNIDFADKTIWKKQNDQTIYTSKTLSALWPAGFSTVGDVTFQSAAYVARYITKKITGPMADLYYMDIDRETGEIHRDLKPEYITMSRRPGIGKAWYDKYKSDVFPDDFIILNGKKMRTPKFYADQLAKEFPEQHAKTLAKRQIDAKAHELNNTPDRLAVREELHLLKASNLKRSYENDY